MPKRSAHPGVYLLPPKRDGRKRWRAKWIDPDTRDWKYEPLPAAVTTKEGRRGWAIDQSSKLALRRAELAAGAHAMVPEAIATAVQTYLDSCSRLRPRTVASYTATAERFKAWCSKAGVGKTTELTRGKLGAYRDWIVNTPRHAVVKGGKRGQRARTTETRSPRSINRQLTETHTMLSSWLDRDLLKLSERELKRNLKPVPSAEHRIVFYAREEIARLPLGEPFVRFVLLSGVRLGEALSLTWKQVEWQGKGKARKPARLLLDATTKTRKARSVDLTICPSVTLPPEGAPGDLVWSKWNPGKAAAYSKARAFSWQTLRRTCSTYLTCSALYGAATPWHAAKRAGHSLSVAESRYAGLVQVDPKAATLEQAMGI